MNDTPSVADTALSARAVRGATPLLTIEDEPAPVLIVDPPVPEALALGKVYIQYRAANLRLMPVFGAGALDVSPRLGHVHITVDDADWHFVDAGGETVIVVGLPPGPHKVRFDLATPTHQVIGTETVEFVIPAG